MARLIDPHDLKRRHPLCPHCHYDVVATISQESMTCPECGMEFDADDVDCEIRAHDWTPPRGFRVAFRVIGIRSLIAFTAVFTLTALAILCVHLKWRMEVSVLISVVEGGAVGAILSRNLNERAGFASSLLTITACLAAWAVIPIGAGATVLWINWPHLLAYADEVVLHSVFAVLGSCAWIVVQQVMDRI
jgi:hypothetical protein